MNDKVKRSPLFYVGDKYKLLPEIKLHFPEKIERFIEPFTGGGTVFLNVDAKEYLLNDIDKNLLDLHRFLISQAKNPKYFFNSVYETVIKYNLSRSFNEDVVPKSIKSVWKKTFYARFNKIGFNKMRADFNSSKKKDLLKLYLLLIYGFNRILRFNSKGIFNLPVGNVDFNKNTFNALVNYFNIVKKLKLKWSNYDYYDFINRIKFKKRDFVYFDPPYLISFSEYNKLWNEEKEREMISILDKLNSKGVKFAISNMVLHKRRENKIFMQWMTSYNIFNIKSNYISYHDNSVKDINEVLITNYAK